MKKAKALIKQAKQLASSAPSWADLSNMLFDQESGLVARAFPTREERRRFVITEEYHQLRRLLSEAIARHGLVEGAVPKKSGRFVIRIPRTLHEMLEMEACKEGVSLNQLVLFKLAAQVKALRDESVPA